MEARHEFSHCGLEKRYRERSIMYVYRALVCTVKLEHCGRRKPGPMEAL
jgi:hypothetical protein